MYNSAETTSSATANFYLVFLRNAFLNCAKCLYFPPRKPARGAYRPAALQASVMFSRQIPKANSSRGELHFRRFRLMNCAKYTVFDPQSACGETLGFRKIYENVLK